MLYTMKVKKLSAHSCTPSYARPGDAGLDLYSIENQTLLPTQRVLIRTGIAIELPPGSEAQVRPRSGLATKHGVTVLNSPGTIDSGFRGEVCVLLINLGPKTFQVTPGMKIAQLVVAPVLTVNIKETSTLSRTSRGTSTTLADFWVAMRFGDSQGGFCVIHRWSALEGRPWVEDGKRSLNSG